MVIGLLILAAAAAWGYGTHLLRRELREMPTLALTFWMLAMTLVTMVTVTVVFERDSWRLPNAGEWASIVYNMVLAIAFCHAAWSHLARTLPPPDYSGEAWSLIGALQADEFGRVRMGVGPARPIEDLVSYLLSPFRKADLEIVADLLEQVNEAVKVILKEGIPRAMNRFNRRVALPQS